MFKETMRRRMHFYRIEYTIMVNGENYARSIEMPGRDEEDAKANWKKYRDKSFNEVDYTFNSISQIR